jgi:hypothetical protein
MYGIGPSVIFSITLSGIKFAGKVFKVSWRGRNIRSNRTLRKKWSSGSVTEMIQP